MYEVDRDKEAQERFLRWISDLNCIVEASVLYHYIRIRVVFLFLFLFFWHTQQLHTFSASLV